MTARDILTPNTPSLGFGAMRMPDLDHARKMVDAYMESGYNYFDTAYAYGGSEELLKNTLTTRHPRESYMLANKLPPWEIKKPEDMEATLKESLKRCGLDYIDFYLVHSISDARDQHIKDMGMFEFAMEQKKRGLARHVGFSFHGSTQYLEEILNRHPEMEFVQLQLNYIDILRGPAGEWQALALKHNKPIIVMEPIKGGSLASLPEAAEALLKAADPTRSIASWAMQYAATLEGVTSILSGMSSLEQVQDNLKTFKDLKPLTLDEMDLLENVLKEMSKVSSIPCTACKYCHKVCPKGIDIATCFSLYNEAKRGESHMWNRKMFYNLLPNATKANKCIDCQLCIEYCPQQINIPGELQIVDEAFKN
ncbi:MAG: aldo/keto reductase [Defluviitaleaceae bacterium]|nr:aldo/keto reductase [Defluviitaleaceae bacterium]